MARFLIERTFPSGLSIPANEAGARAWLRVVEVNAVVGVTWLHSYVSEDLLTMVCVYDAPDADSIRRAAQGNGLPVDSIRRVTVLEPFVYTGVAPAEPRPVLGSS
jgi:hypothetical protein